MNGRCIWLSHNLERATLRKYCLWRSPACLINSNSTNNCIAPSRDQQMKGFLVNEKCIEYRDLILIDIKQGKYNVTPDVISFLRRKF